MCKSGGKNTWNFAKGRRGLAAVAVNIWAKGKDALGTVLLSGTHT